MASGSARNSTIYPQEKPNNAERDTGLLSMSTPVKSLKKFLLPVLLVVCALGGGTVTTQGTTIYDGTYIGELIRMIIKPDGLPLPAELLTIQGDFL